MEMDSVVIKLCWSVLLIVSCSSILLKLIKKGLLKPNRIRSMLSKQGVGGPKPSLFFGNVKDIQKIESSLNPLSSSSSSGPVSNQDWVLSIFPHLQKWTRDYGRIYMFSTGSQQHLFVNRPELIKELKMHKSLDLGTPGYLSKALEPMLGSGIIKANGQQWAHQRRLIAPEFFPHKVKGMIGLMEECTMSMISKWESLLTESEGGVLDLLIDQDLRSLSADIISRACFGSSYAQGKSIFLKLRAMQEVMSKPSLLFGLPNIRWLPTKSNREIRRLKKEVEDLILKVVKDRQEKSLKDGKSSKDLLQMILESADADNELHQYIHKTDRFIVDNCKNIYFAGYETTALSASWTLMLLALHPEWQERVRAEAIEMLGDCTDQPHCSLDVDTISQLKMLTMVVQESMRLYPPSVVMAREAFADIKLGDFVVPKGLHIWSLIPALHRDPENWGADSNEFKPERFANGISEACKYPQTYIPFGTGTRLCVGQNFAMLELKIMLSLLLSRAPRSCKFQIKKENPKRTANACNCLCQVNLCKLIKVSVGQYSAAMALVIRNCFDVLVDDETIEYSNNIDDAVPKKMPAATNPPLPNAGTKKNQKQKQAPGMKNQETKSETTSVMRQAKPRQSHGHDNFVGRSGTKIIRTPNPKEKQHVTNSGDAMQNHHQTQTVVNDVERKLSLKEYEEELLEKKKTLNLNLKNAADHEGRKLSPDKDFESMTLVGKKKEDCDGLLIKPAKPNTKANKVHNNKAVDVSRIFQVPVTRSRRPYAVDNGESTSTGTTNKADASAAIATVNIGDGAQFPALK